MERLSKHGHGGRQLHAHMKGFMRPTAHESGRDLCKGSVHERAAARDVSLAGSTSELVSAIHVVQNGWKMSSIQQGCARAAHVACLLRCNAVLDMLSQFHIQGM